MSAAYPWIDELTQQPDVACLVVGPGLAVSFATAAVERMLGASAGSLVGVTMDQLMPVERRGELKNFEDVLGGGGSWRLRSALRCSDGRRLDVSLTLAPLADPAGRIVAVGARYEPARSSAQWVRASMPPRATSTAPAAPLEYPTPSLFPEPARPAANSEQRLSPARAPSRAASDVHARLGQLEGHLRWLEERLSSPPSIAPLDDPRERARALLVVGEARDVTAQCRTALESDLPPASAIPAPPKLPRI